MENVHHLVKGTGEGSLDSLFWFAASSGLAQPQRVKFNMPPPHPPHTWFKRPNVPATFHTWVEDKADHKISPAQDPHVQK